MEYDKQLATEGIMITLSTFGSTYGGKFTTPGMLQRAAIRSFAKANGTLTESGSQVLNALDRLEHNQIQRQQLHKDGGGMALRAQQQANAVDFLTPCTATAASARHAATMAGSYRSQATSYAQQARLASATGDEATAARMRRKALEAADKANQMDAEEARLAKAEAEERAAKLRRESADKVQERKAQEKARAAYEAAKKEQLEQARAKELEAKEHLREAREEKQKIRRADTEAWGKRLEHAQFWIHQNQLLQEGKHPAQAVAQAQIQAFRDAKVNVATVAPDFTPVPLAA